MRCWTSRRRSAQRLDADLRPADPSAGGGVSGVVMGLLGSGEFDPWSAPVDRWLLERSAQPGQASRSSCRPRRRPRATSLPGVGREGVCSTTRARAPGRDRPAVTREDAGSRGPRRAAGRCLARLLLRREPRVPVGDARRLGVLGRGSLEALADGLAVRGVQRRRGMPDDTTLDSADARRAPTSLATRARARAEGCSARTGTSWTAAFPGARTTHRSRRPSTAGDARRSRRGHRDGGGRAGVDVIGRRGRPRPARRGVELSPTGRRSRSLLKARSRRWSGLTPAEQTLTRDENRSRPRVPRDHTDSPAAYPDATSPPASRTRSRCSSPRSCPPSAPTRRVNKVTATLFGKYRTPQDYLKVPEEELAADIKPTGFFNQKTRSIRGACQRIVEAYGGRSRHDGGADHAHGRRAQDREHRARQRLRHRRGDRRRHTRRTRREPAGVHRAEHEPDKIEQDLMRLIPESGGSRSRTCSSTTAGRSAWPARRGASCPVSPLCPSSLV